MDSIQTFENKLLNIEKTNNDLKHSLFSLKNILNSTSSTYPIPPTTTYPYHASSSSTTISSLTPSNSQNFSSPMKLTSTTTTPYTTPNKPSTFLSSPLPSTLPFEELPSLIQSPTNSPPHSSLDYIQTHDILTLLEQEISLLKESKYSDNYNISTSSPLPQPSIPPTPLPPNPFHYSNLFHNNLNSPKSYSFSNSNQLSPSTQKEEENRKKEKEMVITIAEHDAILIRELRAENQSLKNQLNHYQNLLNHEKKNIEVLEKTLELKDKQIESISSALFATASAATASANAATATASSLSSYPSLPNHITSQFSEASVSPRTTAPTSPISSTPTTPLKLNQKDEESLVSNYASSSTFPPLTNEQILYFVEKELDEFDLFDKNIEIKNNNNILIEEIDDENDDEANEILYNNLNENILSSYKNLLKKNKNYKKILKFLTNSLKKQDHFLTNYLQNQLKSKIINSTLQSPSTPSNSSTPSHSLVSTPNNHTTSSPSTFSPSISSPSSLTLNEIVQYYKKREEEMLEVLQSVVKKCEIYEEEIKERKKIEENDLNSAYVPLLPYH